MNSDRAWISVQDALPTEQQTVLVGYCEEFAVRLFLGVCFPSGWAIGDSEENPRPRSSPDIWIDIPLPGITNGQDF